MPAWQRSYDLRTDRVKSLTGIDVPAAETAAILGKLGFAVSGNGPWTASRCRPGAPDIVGEADLVEEVTRVYRLRQYPDHVAAAAVDDISKPVRNPMQRACAAGSPGAGARARHERGRHLVVPAAQEGRAFRRRPGRPVPAELDRRHARHDAALDPAQPDRCAARNEARGLVDPALFEVGPQYKVCNAARAAHRGRRYPPQHGNPAQLGRSCAHGRRFRCQEPMRWPCWPRSARPTIFSTQSGAPDWYHPGRSGAIKLGDRVMAYFGELHPEIAAAADFKGSGHSLRSVPRCAAAARGQGEQGTIKAGGFGLLACRT